ncbi:hypothetical protein OY671_011696, partial [Metschnikowia pulcherrima]
RAARRLRRGDGGQAGRRDRADHAAGAPALCQFRRTLFRLPAQHRPPFAPRSRKGSARDPRRAGRRHHRYRDRHARAAVQAGAVQAAGPGDRGRGTASRRGPQGKAQGAEDRRPRSDADRHAHPAHPADGKVGPARTVHDPGPAGRSPGRADLCDAVGRRG